MLRECIFNKSLAIHATNHDICIEIYANRMDWLIDLGYLGLFIGTFVAGTVLPLSSDVLMVGLLAAGGNPWICLVIATIGNWSGAMTSYVLGWFAKWEWLEKYFKISPDAIERQHHRIDRYGIWLAAIYWAPIVGIVIMVALGLYKIRPRTTALVALVGAFLRFLFWILMNAVLQQTTLFS